MSAWLQPQQLADLARFYERAKKHPDAFSDAEFIENVTKAFWGTNCWSFAEAAFAMIAPGCLMRPHLAREFIKHPIEAMIAGGLADPNKIVSFGVACAMKEDHYVEPTDDGKRWLLDEWPKLDNMVNEVFHEVWNELYAD